MCVLGGSFLYVAPIEGRSGMEGLEAALAASGIECTHKQLATPEYVLGPCHLLVCVGVFYC